MTNNEIIRLFKKYDFYIRFNDINNFENFRMSLLSYDIHCCPLSIYNDISNGIYLRIINTESKNPLIEISESLPINYKWIAFTALKNWGTKLVEQELRGREKKITNHINNDDAVDSMRYFVTERLNDKKEKEEMKILNLYNEKMKDKIDKEYDKKIIELESNDELQLTVKEMLNQLDTILENNGERTLKEQGNTIILDLYLSKTVKAKQELLDEKREKLKELSQKLEEIDALFYLTEDYQERMKILQNYGIVNKKGQIIYD